MDRDSIVLRKGTSEDHLNLGLEIFQKGPSRTGKDAREPKGKGDARGKEESEWTAERAAGESPDRCVSAPKTLSSRSVPRLHYAQPQTRTPAGTWHLSGPAPGLPAPHQKPVSSSTRQRLHRPLANATTDNSIGRRAEPRRARQIREWEDFREPQR